MDSCWDPGEGCGLVISSRVLVRFAQYLGLVEVVVLVRGSPNRKASWESSSASARPGKHGREQELRQVSDLGLGGRLFAAH